MLFLPVMFRLHAWSPSMATRTLPPLLRRLRVTRPAGRLGEEKTRHTLFLSVVLSAPVLPRSLAGERPREDIHRNPSRLSMLSSEPGAPQTRERASLKQGKQGH